MRVPSTLMALAGRLSLTPILYHPAMWKTPSTPSMGARIDSLSVISPAASVHAQYGEVSGLCWRTHQRDHLVPRRAQLPRDASADKSCRSSDEVLHR